MSKIALKNTGIKTTTLGFGCGGLMRITSARMRQKVLSEAYDSGIVHFDVAPIYGLGRAETDVGRFARGKRDQLVLATKFGLQVNRASGMVSALQGLARRALTTMPAIRDAVRKRSHMLYAPKNFDAATAQRSLEESLRALRTEYVDIFLLHEPELIDVKDTGIWEYLQCAKDKGMIRAWGVAGYPEQIRPICEEIPELARIIQIPNDVVSRQLVRFDKYDNADFITFSPYSGAYERLHRLVDENRHEVEKFAAKTGVDPRQPGVLAKLMLCYCLHSNPAGVTLFFSGRPEGVRENVAAWRGGCHAETVRTFESLVTEIIGSGHDGPNKQA